MKAVLPQQLDIPLDETGKSDDMQNLNILYIVSHWSGAPAYGAQQRVLQIGRLLQKVGDVKLVVVNGDMGGEQWRVPTEAEFKIARVISVKPVPSGGFLERIHHELDTKYLKTVPFGVDLVDRMAVLELINGHDVIWVHTIKTANLLGIYHWPRSVIDIDDIPSRFYESSARVGTSFMRRMLDRRMSVIWFRRERRLTERFRLLMTCSEDDRQYLGRRNIRVLPNGFQGLAHVERRPVNPPCLGFIGTFKWDPNVEGVRWFCKHVWPIIKKELADARLRVVGQGTQLASDWGEDVEGVGYVDDATQEIATWSVMVVPIRMGGGTRIKVLEGCGRKCPIVTTTVGAFGYGLNDGDELYVADKPETFASRCVELIRSPRAAEMMAERAYRRFLRSWSWDSYYGIVQAAVEEAARMSTSLSGSSKKVKERQSHKTCSPVRP